MQGQAQAPARSERPGDVCCQLDLLRLHSLGRRRPLALAAAVALPWALGQLLQLLQAVAWLHSQPRMRRQVTSALGARRDPCAALLRPLLRLSSQAALPRCVRVSVQRRLALPSQAVRPQGQEQLLRLHCSPSLRLLATRSQPLRTTRAQTMLVLL